MTVTSSADIGERGERRFSLAAIGAAWTWAWATIAALLDAEQGRWFLWLPVFFGAGIGIYFALPFEPELALAVGAFAIAFVGRVLGRTRLPAFLLSTMALAMSAGFLCAKIRAAVMAAPVLERQGAYDLEGFIESFEQLGPKRGRAVVRLRGLKFEDKPVAVPFRARISVRGQAALRPGDYVKLKAVLRPPPEPVRPGGFDYARMSYFQGIGASGFALNTPKIEAQVALPFDMRVRARLAELRGRIGARILEVLPGQTGAIAAALTVGQSGGLNEEAMADLRASGLAHVISISGLHMSLVAGVTFWVCRFLLALIPAVAVRYSTRALAGSAALVLVTVYLALSGAAVAAVRSYIMIVVVFLAVLLNRPALSLRNVALAALLILAVLPDSLIDVSFQMSFAATAALIAGYERFSRHLRFEARGVLERLVWQPVLFAAAVFVTTLTAGLAVEPFSAYHFHSVTSYGALGNLLGGPPVDFIAMPAMIAALIAMPFGLDEWPLKIMGAGIDAMMAVAKFVAGLPGATVNVAAFPFAALLFMVLGGLWLIIWRRRWALLGIPLIGAGLALSSVHDRPDIYVDREGRTVAVRDRKGELQAPRSRKASFSLKEWLKSDGDGRAVKDAASGFGFQCDSVSCLTMVKGRLLSFVTRPDALAEDCQRAAILIASIDVTVACPGPALVLDRALLYEQGASTITFVGGRAIVDHAQRWRTDRPWARPRSRREIIPPVPSAAQPNTQESAD